MGRSSCSHPDRDSLRVEQLTHAQRLCQGSFETRGRSPPSRREVHCATSGIERRERCQSARSDSFDQSS
jgi:hypothetical protein